MKLITPDAIIEAFSDSPAVVKTFIEATILSPRWQDVMANPHQPSSYYWVRITRASLLKHINDDNSGEKMTITELRKITKMMGVILHDLITESVGLTGVSILPAFKSKYNKRSTEDYIMFAVINGHASQNPDFRVFTKADLNNELCKSWQVGRRFSLNLCMTPEHDPEPTEHDYIYDITDIKETEWCDVVSKNPVGRPRTKPAKKKSNNPVGRPRKKVDPFNNPTPPSKRRTTLKSIMQQFNERTDALMNMIRPKRWVYDYQIIAGDDMFDVMSIMNSNPVFQDAEILQMIQADKATIVAYRTPANN